ncbi:hypothetical protein AAHB41_00940 [Pediococcus pentosaceus]|jgi:hypothetical protein|uniref:Uncharacterized protein n=3 Tax=Pediococcus pentosaceus TaxID=1255 RepID=A0A0R2HAH5_PEDPE|nr:MULTISPECIES: hypothetical protein [Pediococcus]ABJ68773.1 hypothetical protein PEPE_1752 [Pediococcus pentosaceus ATCC 25745]AVL02183.1 hypothetical protein PP40703_04920 [Pediococcus pentosaceus]AXR44194.1 hypothetical protein CKK51_08765 [Pediococcus pentosaceus]KAF0351705.1 hypothetical protein GBO26_01400 [Pediococcus pentosaceus]KAF0394982.1 hypothetical protein GBO69_03890 [Pediococcus pentosaceus]
MSSVIGTLLIIAIAGLQYLCSRIKYKYSGAVIPILFAGSMLYYYLIAQKASFWAFLIILVVGEILLLSIWDNQYQKNEQKTEQTHLRKK